MGLGQPHNGGKRQTHCIEARPFQLWQGSATPHRMITLEVSTPKFLAEAMSKRCSTWIQTAVGTASSFIAFRVKPTLSTLRTFTASSSCRRVNVGRLSLQIPHTREARLWRFGDTVQSRAWHERKGHALHNQ